MLEKVLADKAAKKISNQIKKMLSKKKLSELTFRE
jgi:hypothetical protein